VSTEETRAGDAGQRTILMGDPSHFSVKGGANPHTRTRWGTRRHVDRERAIGQWHRLKSRLEEHGIRVIVVPPDPEQPGLVYPANAGVQSNVDACEPIAQKRFILSNLLPSRAGEKQHYQRVLTGAGYAVEEIDPSLRFEGEADFFPAGDVHLLTHGVLERQRFVATWSIPPWRRVYGFRTDVRVEEILAPRVAPKRVLKIGLTRETHYHGDTALCAFGTGRRFLLGYRGAVEDEGWALLEAEFGDDLIELGSEDAGCYAANSFTYTDEGADSYLFMPGGVSQRLQAQVRERGVTPVVLDVSEFLKKGGGSVKCMIGDLGVVAEG
jgi:N-dimethylarginine dimethylaminohydrolase